MGSNEPGEVRSPSVLLGERIRELRTDRGWSLQDLADRMREHGVKLHKTTVAKVETAERRVPLDELLTFAYVLDVAPVHLFVPPELQRSDVRIEVAPDITPGPVGLRAWMRGEVALTGQDERRFAINRPYPDFADNRGLGQRHERLALVAQQARLALAEGDVTKASNALAEVALLTQLLQRQLGFPEGPSATVEEG